MRGYCLFLSLLAALGLSGCYMSDRPLISAEDAAFPYETITYKPENDDSPSTMRREGDSYVMRSPDGADSIELRFKDLGDGLYLAQMSGENNGKVAILYSLLKVDWEAKKVSSYKAMANTDEERPGLHKCNDGSLCIDDLDVYLSLAKEAVATDKPDAVYDIMSTE